MDLHACELNFSVLFYLFLYKQEIQSIIFTAKTNFNLYAFVKILLSLLFVYFFSIR